LGHVCIYQRKIFGQVTILESNVLHDISSALPICQDALHAAMSQAFEICALDLLNWYRQPLQQLPGPETETAALDETGCELAIEAVPGPALISYLDAASLASIR
jgi:hypothetical protein